MNKSINEKILYSFSLNFIDPSVEKNYLTQTKQYTFQILNLFCAYSVLAASITFLRSVMILKISSILRSIFIGVLMVAAINFVKKQKKRQNIEIGFCIIVIFIYFIHTKVFFTALLEVLSPRHFIYLTGALETFRVFLFISKIKWIYICVANLLMNFLQYHYILTEEEIHNSPYKFLTFFTFVLTNTLPFIAFFQERNFKLLFYKSLQHDRSLKNLEELINKLLPNQIIILNETKTHILFCNEEVHLFFNSWNYENIYTRIIEFKFADSAHNLLDILKISELSKEFLTEQISLKDENNKKECIFNVKLGEIKWENQKAFLILLSDISAVKLAQKLQELDAYKDRLMATVSHDLRTPLNGLLGILEILLGNIREKELKKLIKIGIRCSNLLLFMINDILDFSQISNGKLKLVFSKSKIFELVQEVITLLKFQCQRKNIELKTEIPAELNDQILYVDHRRVQQILLNLISNALKFTNHGFIKLSISKNLNTIPPTIEFSVEDTGIGIKEIDIPKLFQLFGKLDQKNPNVNQTGVGLGLVISKHLLELLWRDKHKNANIWVKSIVGKGSTFGFRLPLDIEEDEEINEEYLYKDKKVMETMSFHRFFTNNENSQTRLASSNCNSPTNIRKKCIKLLLVDDDQINLFVLGKYLEAFGISYDTAYDGKMAVEMIFKDKSKYNLILMDCNMPIMNGYEASSKIKEILLKFGSEDIPILALSANTSSKEIEMCFQCGMTGYLAKPVSKQQMKEKLQQILKVSIHEDMRKTFKDLKNGFSVSHFKNS